MQLRNRPLRLVIIALVVSIAFPTWAQENDPTAQIVELATQVHIQNLRTENFTRWVGGDLGDLRGIEIGAEAGTTFTAWHFTDIDDESHRVDINHLERPVLINLWASWCGPCRLEFPLLVDYALHETTNYDVWFVNAADTPSAARQFLESQPQDIEVYVDPLDSFVNSIGVVGYPTTVLMDTDGTILAAHTGEVSRTIMEFFDAIAAHPYLGHLDTATLNGVDLKAVLDPIDLTQATSIELGERVGGDITDTAWQHTYRYHGEAGQEINATMLGRDSDLDPYLVLLGPDGERLAENDDMSHSSDAQIRLVLPTTGTYIIVATRLLERDGLGYGRFFLQINEATTSDNGLTRMLSLGIPVSDSLTPDYRQDAYVVEAVAGQTLTINLTHDNPDATLSLQTSLVPFSRTQNGMLTITAEILTTGNYNIYISRPQNAQAESITYTLVVSVE